MEIVLIRHGQPDWGSGVNAYTANPELTELGRIQSKKSSAVFDESSIDELWVSPLARAQETHNPFKDRSVSKEIHVFEWLKDCLLYTSPSPRDGLLSRMPASA